MSRLLAYSLLLSALAFAILTLFTQITQPADITHARGRLNRILLYSVLMTIALLGGLSILVPDRTASSFLCAFPVSFTFFVLHYGIGLLLLRRRSRPRLPGTPGSADEAGNFSQNPS